MFLSCLLFQVATDQDFFLKCGIVLLFSFLNSVFNLQNKQLFELIRYVQLPEMQVFQDLIIGLLPHCDDRLILSGIERLHVFDSRELREPGPYRPCR